jgi:sugar/nucleoside kinase (ribokinase family)
MKQFDFVAIGDVVVDAFIRLQDAHITCRINSADCEICMKYGSKVPFEYAKVLAGVGNSANAAVSASRLGLSSALVAPTGNDLNGQLCIDTLAADGVDTQFINKQDLPTNYHYVLWYGDERTILIKHEKYAYSMPDIGSPKFIYLSSLGEDAANLHGEIVEYLKSHPESRLAFQPGTFQIKMGVEALRELYAHTDVFVCNLEEAQIITGLTTRDVRELSEKLASFGPKTVFVTDGAKGAYSYSGGDLYYMPVYPDPSAPVERTGAGDAFASTLVSCVALGMSPEEALRRAPINSMSVVQHIGAQEGLLTREQLEQYLADAPADYVSKKL